MRITQALFDEPQAIEPGKDRAFLWDDELKGFGIVHLRSGAKSFVVQYRVGGKSRRQHLKKVTSEKQARKLAQALLGKVIAGQALGELVDPVGKLHEERRQAREERARAKEAQAATERTLAKVAAEYIEKGARDSSGQRLRSVDEKEGILDRAILPTLGARPIGDIKRSEIVALMDAITKQRGSTAARKGFALLSTIFNWEARRSDTFQSPLVRGMGPKVGNGRERVLTNEELKAIWKAAGTLGAFGQFVQFQMLTATRRNEALLMRWDEVEYIKNLPDGALYNSQVWTIGREGYKTKQDVALPLSAKAQELLDSIERTDGVDLVFTNDGRPMSVSHGKRALDEASGVRGWRLHDLRRTARTIMSRTVRDANGRIDPNDNIDGDTKERMLGHVVRGIRGVYDRYDYLIEKRTGFEILAERIDAIVNGD
jgi:integrase